MNEIRDIHEPFIAWLRKLEVPYHRNRPDKKTTAIKGDPDFLVTFMSRCVYIECKIPGNRLSTDQEERIAYIRKSGNKVVVAYSLEDCIEAVKNILCEGKPAALLEPRGEALGPYAQHDWDGLKDKVRTAGVQPVKAPKAQKQPSLPVNGNGERREPFYIGRWQGADYVMARSQNGNYNMIRQASAADLINFPKLPAAGSEPTPQSSLDHKARGMA